MENTMKDIRYKGIEIRCQSIQWHGTNFYTLYDDWEKIATMYLLSEVKIYIDFYYKPPKSYSSWWGSCWGSDWGLGGLY